METYHVIDDEGYVQGMYYSYMEAEAAAYAIKGSVEKITYKEIERRTVADFATTEEALSRIDGVINSI